MPVDLLPGKKLAVIAGRAFLRSADYRALAERFRAGDLAGMLSEDLFRNVIFALKQDLDELAVRIADGADVFTTNRGSSTVTVEDEDDAAVLSSVAVPEKIKSDPAHSTIPQGESLKELCDRSVELLIDQHKLQSVALLLRDDESFQPVSVSGEFRKKPPRIVLKATEIKLLQAASNTSSIALASTGRTAAKHQNIVECFLIDVGNEIKGALLVDDKGLTDEQRKTVSSLCRDIAMPIEVLRLREELERRMRAASHLRTFTEIVNTAQPEDAYTTILRHSAELLRAERGSLLLFDERSNELSVKAAVGPHSEEARNARVRVGEGVAGTALSEGRPLVVRDVATLQGIRPAPAERSYKTRSFISYPITVGNRKVGVLNVTDKAGGGVYDELDLRLLDAIAPQMALALDRAEWHHKATQFQLLSITDPLTGLVNRRYLEERLAEELEQSKRRHFAMSFLMMDIDDFKAYNDRHGHPAGDLALEITAQCLKSALRSADTAARYGGEEFSILLPQTGITEAQVIAERIRRRVERTHFPHGKSQPLGAVTVSIGISAFGQGLDTAASIIYAADQALYIAKKRRKNCVEVFEPESLSEENRARLKPKGNVS
jgi:diguanylate cyclase (GGDEF)-like protein